MLPVILIIGLCLVSEKHLMRTTMGSAPCSPQWDRKARHHWFHGVGLEGTSSCLLLFPWGNRGLELNWAVQRAHKFLDYQELLKAKSHCYGTTGDPFLGTVQQVAWLRSNQSRGPKQTRLPLSERVFPLPIPGAEWRFYSHQFDLILPYFQPDPAFPSLPPLYATFPVPYENVTL